MAKHYAVDRDAKGRAVGISRHGWRVLVLNAGAERNEAFVAAVVAYLNNPGPFGCLCRTMAHHVTGDGCKMCNPQEGAPGHGRPTHA